MLVYKGNKIMRIVAISVVLLLAALQTRGEDFQNIAIRQAGFMAISEDGKHIILSHERENLLTVVSVVTGEILKKHKCLSPGAMLCRGERAYVVNNHLGTITVLSQKADYRPVDQLEVGDEEILGLSAPTGANFNNELLVTCRRKNGHIGRDTIIYLVDAVKDRYKVLLRDNEPSPMICDAEGNFAHNQRTVYDYRQLLARKPVALCETEVPFGCDRSNLGQQVLGDNWYVISSSVMAGLPCVGMREPQAADAPTRREIVSGYYVADQTSGLIYRLYGTPKGGLSLQAYRPQMPWTPLAARELDPKDFNKLRRNCLSFSAATHGGKLYIYSASGSQDGLLRLETDAFDAGAAASHPALADLMLPRLEYALCPSADGKSMLLLQGCRFFELSADGKEVLHRRRLGAMYRTFHERKDYYAALGVDSVDLLDKKTLEVKKRIPLPDPMPRAMTASPNSEVCYVLAWHPLQNNMGANTVTEVNESTGKTATIKDFNPRSFRITADGDRLIGFNCERSNLSSSSPNPHWLDQAYPPTGSGSWSQIKFCRLRDKDVKDVPPRNLNSALGELVFSPDGKQVAVGTQDRETSADDGSRTKVSELVLVSSDDLSTRTGTVKLPPLGIGEGVRVVFHPSGRYLLVKSPKKLELMDLQTGKALEGAIDLDVKGLREYQFDRFVFSADGRNLIVVKHESAPPDDWLRVISLKLKLP